MGYNLYAYCNDNPVMYVDYDGHFGIVAAMIIGACIGALFGGGIAGVTAYNQGERDLDLFFDIFGGSIMGATTGIAAVLGGAAGLTAVYGSGAVLGYSLSAKCFARIMGLTAVGGMVKYGCDCAYSPNADQFSMEDFIFSGINGAIQGMGTFVIAYFAGKSGAFNRTFNIDMLDFYSKSGVNIVNFLIASQQDFIGANVIKYLVSTWPGALIRYILSSIIIKKRK